MSKADISTSVMQALQDRQHWGASRAHAVAKRLRHAVPRGSIDWDQGAGENWIRVLTASSNPAGIVAVPLPIAIVERQWSDQCGPLPEVALVAVTQFDAATLCMDIDVLQELLLAFHEPPAAARGFDVAGFSAQQLWYVTV